MRVLYFAWVRERIGLGEEDLGPLPATTVGDLIALLAARSERHAAALGERKAIRVAVNQDFATDETEVRAGDEIAIFPPVTGG